MITPKNQHQLLMVQGMNVGKTYSIIVPDDPNQMGCVATPEIVSGGVEVIFYDEPHRQIQFIANDKTMYFRLNYPCEWNQPPTHYISIICESCQKVKWKDMMAVLTTTSGESAEELVKEVLIGGNCFDVQNVSYLGNSAAIGTFANGLTNIGFNSGVIMATGATSVAEGPNDSDNASAGFGVPAADPDLTQLSGSGSIYDRASIEFDFTPTQTPLTFEYVFGSEEYCEYVGSTFNDAFGFFIAGPGISGPFGGAANIAVIPATTTYVTINNVQRRFVCKQPGSEQFQYVRFGH